jgi:hypothetical protein
VSEPILSRPVGSRPVGWRRYSTDAADRNLFPKGRAFSEAETDGDLWASWVPSSPPRFNAEGRLSSTPEGRFSSRDGTNLNMSVAMEGAGARVLKPSTSQHHGTPPRSPVPTGASGDGGRMRRSTSLGIKSPPPSAWRGDESPTPPRD